MKKKNFLRNLSTMALAMCCLSSAIALSSYACLTDEKELKNGPLCTYVYRANLPVYNDISGKYTAVEKWFINEVQLGPNDSDGSSFSVESCQKDDCGTVIIPKNISGHEISEIASDASFSSDTRVLCVREGVDFDENKIKKNNPQISIVVNNYNPVTYDPAQNLY